MKKLKVLKIIFEQSVPSWKITQFRGAVIAKLGREHVSFHNHLGDDQFHYQYPRIQYKSIGGKAALICIDDGTEDIYAFFQQRNWSIRIGQEAVDLSIQHLSADAFQLRVWQASTGYRINNWLALNEKNYDLFTKAESLVERLTLLERVLTGNILSFAKGVGYFLEEELKVKITSLHQEKWIDFKQNKLKAFDLNFQTNFFLPNYIGLGKGASVGYGVVMKD